MTQSVIPTVFQSREQPCGMGKLNDTFRCETSYLTTYLKGLLVKMKCNNACEYCWHDAWNKITAQ